MAARFPIVDVDSHFYESEAIWSDYLDGAERNAARRSFSRDKDRVILNGQTAKPLNRSKINRQAVWRPGLTPEQIGSLNPDQAVQINPGASDPTARVADLDALGIDQQVVFPTLFGEYLPGVVDVAAASALARAYNDWAHDVAIAAEGRLHPVAVLPLQDIDASIAELDRCARRGARAVTLRPAFYRLGGQEVGPFGSPVGTFVENKPFRPLWRRIEELGLVACVHPYLGIANEEATSEGSFIERVSEKLGVGHTVAEAAAYLQDNANFLVVALFHALLEDCPALKLALLHGGGSMVPLSIEKAETYLWLSPGNTGRGAPVCLEPEEVFQRARVLVGFDGWESSVVRQLDFFADKGAWGSRYPYHDTSTPDEVLSLCERYNVPDEVTRGLLGGNAATFFGLEVPAPV